MLYQEELSTICIGINSKIYRKYIFGVFFGCLSHCLALNLTAEFKRASCSDSDVKNLCGTCLSHLLFPVSDGG